MPKIHSSKARKEYDCSKSGCDKGKIKVGEIYLHYTRRFSRTGKGTLYRRHESCRPRPSELTGSEFLQTVYSAQESFGDQVDLLRAGKLSIDDFQSVIDDAISELESARDGATERRENMPEGLQESETGQMLEERAEACDETISELEDLRSDIEDVKESKTEKDESDEEEATDSDQDEESSVLSDFCDKADGINWPE